jgi:hypothetical protein
LKISLNQNTVESGAKHHKPNHYTHSRVFNNQQNSNIKIDMLLIYWVNDARVNLYQIHVFGADPKSKASAMAGQHFSNGQYHRTLLKVALNTINQIITITVGSSIISKTQT